MYIIMSLYLPRSEILLVYNSVLRSRADSFRFMFLVHARLYTELRSCVKVEVDVLSSRP